MAKLRIPWDGTPDEMTRLKEENQGLLLIEVQNHMDGNFLVFAAPEDVEPSTAEPPKSIEERLTEVETRLGAMEQRTRT